VPSIHGSDQWFVLNDEFVLGFGEVVFSGEPSTIVSPKVSLFLRFPFVQGLALPSLTLPPSFPPRVHPRPASQRPVPPPHFSNMIERKEKEEQEEGRFVKNPLDEFKIVRINLF
jgi:hypothetical protein